MNSGWVSTKRQEVAHLRRFSAFLAAIFVIAGIALSLTVLFLSAGVFLVGLGIFLYPAGTAASTLLPRLHRYRPLACPYCSTVNEVNLEAAGVVCDRCGIYWEVPLELAVEPRRHLQSY